MKQLEKQFRKSGYDYEQVYRSENAAVYSQSSEGRVVGFEAIEVLKAEAGEVFGKPLPEREVYPGSSMWGVKGFTYRDLEKAVNKAKELESMAVDRLIPKMA